ncbi:MAG: hypothetical protein AB7O24_03640 [Kofleriaceae bacterium]
MRNHLVIAVTIALTSSLASAGSNTPPTTADIVKEKLVQPLVAKERKQSKFSRARLPPQERRIRVVDAQPQLDSTGAAFFAFAIDAKHGWAEDDSAESWQRAAITGCVYPASGEVFIKRGKAFHPAEAALGKKTKASAETTCHAAAQLSAR